MAIASRSPLPYLERTGLLRTIRPGPRLNVCGLLVHQYAYGDTEDKSEQANGCPPPDRARLKEWVPPLSE